MSKHLKKFETQAAYEAAFANFDLPNVSLIVEGRQIEYNPTTPPAPVVETKVVCIVSASTTEEPTIFFDEYSCPSASFSTMEIDGVEQSDILASYVFDATGLHTLKFTLIDETSIADDTFKMNGGNDIISIAIPSSVTSIGYGTFFGCNSLSSITIPSSVTSIGENTFNRCNSLSSITIPSSVTSIEAAAFSDCYSLSSITIPSSVTSIGYGAFYNCYSLSSITIPSGVTSIEAETFKYCSSLSSIAIPSSVTSIGYNAFNGCNSLSSITIPSSVTSIEAAAFSDCSSLLSINYQGTISQWESISKNNDWNYSMDSSARIYCTDGDIPVFE